MSNDLAIPDYLKDMMETSTAPKTNDMASGGISVPRISLKGKIFRFKNGGEEVDKVKEDLDVVIVGVLPEHGTAKTFYAGQYSPDSSDPPDCSSTDGVRPDTWVTDPISQTCAGCGNNKFGSAISMSGKKSKACRDSRRLYVVRAKELKDPEPIVWLLNVTVSSLKPLTEYSRELGRQGIPTPSVVVTRLNFDDDTDFPKLTFQPLGVVNEAIAKIALSIAEKKEWDQVTAVAELPQTQRKTLPGEVQEPAKTEDPPKQESSAKSSVDDILEGW